MIYSNFQDKALSSLGLGCMRLPTDDSGKIDMARARDMVAYAIENGVNYFDTAYGYHGGESETAMGELLSAYPRDRFYLASKFPGYDTSNMARVEEIFEHQLEKCRVDYFDFYLFHNVCEKNIDGYLDPKYGIFDYLMKQKKNGRIRHLGFSAHGNMATLRRFLNAYGDAMEFCQLQINWLDWGFQNARAKVELMQGYHIPVWVMEPIRGGSLVALAPAHEEKLRALRPTATNAEWCFRWLQTVVRPTVTLSGMSNMEQLRENIAVFSEEKPLMEHEIAVLAEIARDMTKKHTLPCTACRYCTEKCPQGLDIPWLLELYNEHIYSGGGFIAPMAMESLAKEKLPSSCIGCRGCEEVCPQGIKISEAMKAFSERLGL